MFTIYEICYNQLCLTVVIIETDVSNKIGKGILHIAANVFASGIEVYLAKNGNNEMQISETLPFWIQISCEGLVAYMANYSYSPKETRLYKKISKGENWNG